jgi:hypothetical protein
VVDVLKYTEPQIVAAERRAAAEGYRPATL